MSNDTASALLEMLREAGTVLAWIDASSNPEAPEPTLAQAIEMQRRIEKLRENIAKIADRACTTTLAVDHESAVGELQAPAPPFPVITEAAKVTLKPGDVLVLRIDTPALSRDVHNGAKKWLTEQLPPGIHTLVLSNKESLQVVQRESATGAG